MTTTEQPPDALEHARPGESYGGWASQWGSEEPEGSWRSWLSLGLLVALLVLLGVAASWAVVFFVLAIVASVFLHECGHYVTARWAGMKATEFFIGFGPRIWSFRRGETEYGLKAIPAGAYVRIIGMHNLEEVDEVDEDRTYRAKPYHKRLAVILAGPAMNIALGLFILAAVFATAGRPDTSQWVVGEVSPASSAERAGLEPGDQILAVDGTSMGEFADLRPLLEGREGTEVTFTVLRDGEELQLTTVLDWRPSVATAAAIPGLEPTDLIVSVDGQPVPAYADLVASLGNGEGEATLRIQRAFALYDLSIDRPVVLPAEGSDGFLGIRQSPDVVRVDESVPSALTRAAAGVGGVAVASVQGIGRIFSPEGLGNYAREVNDAATGTESRVEVPDELAYVGPVPGFEGDPLAEQNLDRPVSIIGVIGLLGQVFERDGWAGSLELLAVVNIFLGLINLIPLLPFDGGHAAVATYEAVRSRPGRPYRVDIAKLMPLTYAVISLFILLGVTSMFLDIARPISLP